MIVWIPSTRKRKPSEPMAWHHLQPDERFTLCGRPSFAYGHKFDRTEAEGTHRATQCRTCKGENQRFGPDDSVRGRVA